MNDLQTIAGSNVPALDNALNNLWASLEKTAAANIQAAAGDSARAYSSIELRAMLRTEMLNQAKGLDLASVLIKGRIIDEIENEALYTIHPAGYTTLEALAQDQGISISELSQIRDLTRVIFPWVQAQLHISIHDLWENIGKSNMRELVPVLKRIINGEEARGTVEASAQRVLDDVAATMRTAGQEVDDDTLRTAAVEYLLNNVAPMTNREVRQILRPERAPSINAHLIRTNGDVVVIMSLDDRQEQMLARRLHGYWDPITVALDTENINRLHDLETIVTRYLPALER